jgi:spore coat protein A, manganese oxidase
MVTRRSVLGGVLGASGAGLLTAGALTPLLRAREAETELAPVAGAKVAPPPPFTVRMPTLAQLNPISTLGGQDTYLVTVKEATREIIPGV